ncbi:unnamed protein product, partial [Adineta ricciae]|uniref:Uncharacterized protein n=1 Tax=Adineta ricciae TaxID=249248 RepID=A0A816BS42_ADIRI
MRSGNVSGLEYISQNLYLFICLTAGDVTVIGDMAIGWIAKNGKLYFQDPYSPGFVICYQLYIRQVKIGVVCEIEKKTIGQQFSSSLYSIQKILCTFQFT